MGQREIFFIQNRRDHRNSHLIFLSSLLFPAMAGSTSGRNSSFFPPEADLPQVETLHSLSAPLRLCGIYAHKNFHRLFSHSPFSPL